MPTDIHETYCKILLLGKEHFCILNCDICNAVMCTYTCMPFLTCFSVNTGV